MPGVLIHCFEICYGWQHLRKGDARASISLNDVHWVATDHSCPWYLTPALVRGDFNHTQIVGSLWLADKVVINYSADGSVLGFHQWCLMNVIITQASLITWVSERCTDVCGEGEVYVCAFGADRGMRLSWDPPPLNSLLMSPLETHPIPLIVMLWKREEQCNL